MSASAARSRLATRLARVATACRSRLRSRGRASSICPVAARWPGNRELTMAYLQKRSNPGWRQGGYPSPGGSPDPWSSVQIFQGLPALAPLPNPRSQPMRANPAYSAFLRRQRQANPCACSNPAATIFGSINHMWPGSSLLGNPTFGPAALGSKRPCPPGQKNVGGKCVRTVRGPNPPTSLVPAHVLASRACRASRAKRRSYY